MLNIPSGTERNYRLWVSRDGLSLQMKVDFPFQMTDVNTLHADFISGAAEWKISNDHPAIGAFVKSLKEHRETAHDSISSVATIPLPMRVESSVLQYCFFWDTTYVSYIVLKAAMDSYTAGTDRQAFKDMGGPPRHGDGQEHGESPRNPPATPVTPAQRSAR